MGKRDPLEFRIKAIVAQMAKARPTILRFFLLALPSLLTAGFGVEPPARADDTRVARGCWHRASCPF